MTEAVTFANAAAAIATTEFGAQPPIITERDVLRFLSEHGGARHQRAVS